MGRGRTAATDEAEVTSGPCRPTLPEVVLPDQPASAESIPVTVPAGGQRSIVVPGGGAGWPWRG